MALRRAIEADGRTWVAIANAAGCDKAQIGRFMRDMRSVTVETADGICAALGVECRLVRVKPGGNATPAARKAAGTTRRKVR
ncbi:hypothetical protein RAS1_37810 [Phycisphaerae bacterium RAS1]|nr:hypothetical protein RAS1_37810 [Phycisphaerae bacterium RAS1]